MYTVESLKKQYQEYHDKALEDPHMGSEPQPLFNEDGSFNPRNWNSNQDGVRSRLYQDDIITNINHSMIEYRTSDDNCLDIISSIYFLNDQWYLSINVISEDVSQIDSYVVSWYKCRGCTEAIIHNGSPINIDDYVSLLNLLDSAGFFQRGSWEY